MRMTYETALVASDPDLVGERRLSPRRVIHSPAKLQLERRPVWLPCVVYDISATGARLLLPDFPVLPDQILLNLNGLADPVRCRLVWTADGIAGFRFTGPAGAN